MFLKLACFPGRLRTLTSVEQLSADSSSTEMFYLNIAKKVGEL